MKPGNPGVPQHWIMDKTPLTLRVKQTTLKPAKKPNYLQLTKLYTIIRKRRPLRELAEARKTVPANVTGGKKELRGHGVG